MKIYCIGTSKLIFVVIVFFSITISFGQNLKGTITNESNEPVSDCYLLFIDYYTNEIIEYAVKKDVVEKSGSWYSYKGEKIGQGLNKATEFLRENSKLLDEIEKAHPDIFNILLQVMDHGKLTDHNGRSVDFRNVVLIMTSNAGAIEQASAAMGFGRDRREGEDTKAIEKTFSPEFRNRLDAVISFAPLSKPVIMRVVEKFILQLEAQLMDKNVTFELNIKASEWLASNGYDEKMGARPLSRLIQDCIKKPLAEDLLFGKLTKGGLVKVCIKNGAIHLDISPPDKPRLSSNKPPPLLTAK